MDGRSNPAGVARVKEVALMKRIIVLFTVAVLMLAMSALPVLAKTTGDQPPGPPTLSGGNGAIVVHCNSDEIGGEGAVAINKNAAHGGGDCL
jgi:hypothetical protein